MKGRASPQVSVASGRPGGALTLLDRAAAIEPHSVELLRDIRIEFCRRREQLEVRSHLDALERAPVDGVPLPLTRDHYPLNHEEPISRQVAGPPITGAERDGLFEANLLNRLALAHRGRYDPPGELIGQSIQDAPRQRSVKYDRFTGLVVFLVLKSYCRRHLPSAGRERDCYMTGPYWLQPLPCNCGEMQFAGGCYAIFANCRGKGSSD